MKITLQPDPKCLEIIRNDKDALELSINLLKAFGVPEPATQALDKPHQVELDPEKTIYLLNMACYFPDEIKDQSEWLWAVEVLDEGRIVWLNSKPFLADPTKTEIFQKLPNNLSNLNCSGWPNESLDPAFKKLINLKSLKLSQCEILTNVSELKNLTQLTSLDLSQCISLADVSPLRSITQLAYLDLSFCISLTDVSALGSLTRLTYLDLSGCGSLSDVSGLGSLTQLTSLNLSGCKSLSDVSILGGLTQLTSLKFSECESLSDVSGLGGLIQLIFLDLSGCRILSDVSVLSGLTQLTSLDLSWCESLSDVSVLGRLTQLTSLNLSGCESLSDVSILGSLTQLTSLNLSSCNSLSDKRALGRLTQLTSLNLSWCKSLSDVSALGSLTQLTSLDLSWCKSLSDVSVLCSLTQLTSLDLSQCKSLSDVSALCSLTQLTSLDLSGCHRITHEPNFKRLSKLKSLTVDKHPCQIIDILAHCAMSRRDWGAIQEHLENWSFELGQAIQSCHLSATDLAISLAIGVPNFERFESTFGLVEILHKGSFLPHHPWKYLFHGTLEISGFTSLVELTDQLPENNWTSGAIGGMCSIVPKLKDNPDGFAWVRDFIQSTHSIHHLNPAYLRPIAAQWCLALDELGEDQLLQQWLELLTDPADSTALDSIYLQFAKQALTTGDPEKALKLSLQIQGPKIRDEWLLELAEHHLHHGNVSQAGDLLFLVSHADSRTTLAGKLVAMDGYLDDPNNLHRLLAASEANSQALQHLLKHTPPEFSQTQTDRIQLAASIGTRAVALAWGDLPSVIQLKITRSIEEVLDQWKSR